MAEAAKNLEKEQAATRAQIEETHPLINKIMPLLSPGTNPQAVSRLHDFERHFFADLRDKWDLFRGYVHSALTVRRP